MSEDKLPKILYLSDVPVELSSAGATLLYRLLQFYPKEKLYIIQGVGMNENQPRIPGVEYVTSKSKLDRLRFTRFAKYTKSLFLANQFLKSGKAKRIIQEFQPDIILTVGIRLMWLNAYRLSKQYDLPLYVILHDDWLTTENHGNWHKYLVEMFGKMYRYASGRFCISPTMEKYYHTLYGVHGNVIFPHRGKEDNFFPILTEKKKRSRGLKFCYAGSLFTGDFAQMLDEVALYIGINKGELHIFSYWNKEMLEQYSNLKAQHVTFHNFKHPSDLMRIMNVEMDVAILLNSFQHENAFKYNFSSKLVDYISSGLPVLFWGPSTAGSMVWALSIQYEALLTNQDTSKLADLVNAFNDNEKRIRWAKQINDAGEEQFSYEKNYKIFIDKISTFRKDRSVL